MNGWGYEYDSDHAQIEREDAVMVLVYDEAGDVLDSLGGITLESLQISDHGNVNLSPEDEAYLASVAHDLSSSFNLTIAE